MFVPQASFADDTDFVDGRPPMRCSLAYLYTRNGVVGCELYIRMCTGGCCVLDWAEEAKLQHIFFLTDQTAVAEEIGWDLVYSVLYLGKTSFSGKHF